MIAKVIPWSSTVGTGVALLDAVTGENIGQLMLLNVKVDSGSTLKDQHEKMAQEVADAINANGSLPGIAPGTAGPASSGDRLAS